MFSRARAFPFSSSQFRFPATGKKASIKLSESYRIMSFPVGEMEAIPGAGNVKFNANGRNGK